MGEIAEMMLDGTLCEGCGEYLGEGDGFPQYCSASCAGDRGADPSQIHHNPGNRESAKLKRSPNDFLAIRNNRDIEKLADFLNARDYDLVRHKKKDRKGQPMIGLIYSGGRARGGDKRGLIVCATHEIKNLVLPIVQAAKIEKGNQ